MMAVRIRLCMAMVTATALAACGGGGGSDDGDGDGGGGGPVSGLPNPEDIVGADPAYINALNAYLTILNDPIFAGGPTDLPQRVSATYEGVGRIYDASINVENITAAALRNRSVVTDVSATVNFDARRVDVTQDRFLDVNGNRVLGEVTWSGDFNAAEGGFIATVEGNVGGTVFRTPDDNAAIAFRGDATQSAIAGLFVNGEPTTTGWLQGDTIG